MSVLTAAELEELTRVISLAIWNYDYTPRDPLIPDARYLQALTAARALAALTPPAEGDVAKIQTRLTAELILGWGGSVEEIIKIAREMSDLLTRLSADNARLQHAALDAVKKKDELHLRLEPLQSQLLAESEARVAADAERDAAVKALAIIAQSNADGCEPIFVQDRAWGVASFAEAVVREFDVLSTIKEPKP